MTTKNPRKMSAGELWALGNLKRKKIMFSIPPELIELYDEVVVRGKNYNDRSAALITAMTNEIIDQLGISQK